MSPLPAMKGTRAFGPMVLLVLLVALAPSAEAVSPSGATGFTYRYSNPAFFSFGYVTPGSGSVIRFYRDLDRTCQSIASVSEQDAEAYRQFINDWLPLNASVFEAFLEPPTTSNLGRRFFFGQRRSSPAQRSDLLRKILSSYGKLITDTFQDERLRAAMAWWGAQSGPPPMDTASAEFIGWHSMIHR